MPVPRSRLVTQRRCGRTRVPPAFVSCVVFRTDDTAFYAPLDKLRLMPETTLFLGTSRAMRCATAGDHSSTSLYRSHPYDGRR